MRGLYFSVVKFMFESECFWLILLLVPILISVAAMLPVGKQENEKDAYKKR